MVAFPDISVELGLGSMSILSGKSKLTIEPSCSIALCLDRSPRLTLQPLPQSQTPPKAKAKDNGKDVP